MPEEGARGVSMMHASGRSKGYIGPIGDDFPSLIPLIFGLLMFFTAFTITFNAFDNANTHFTDDTTLLRISRTLQSNSYIFSKSNFTDLCSQIGIVNLKFVAVLTEDWAKPQGNPQATVGAGQQGIFGATIFKDAEGNPYYCSNQGTTNPSGVSDFVSLDKAPDARIVSRIFPIVVEDDKVVKPMHLVVVAWK